ncbi:hypothetical protein JNUCC0626_40075 [Lentzea sp. JNUCC 0626]|uniref:hypothetical protein n=1 Tax=Lentzea sp. JNUCC 0626 TaxID=3367513 RepID=UPI003748C4F7
MKISLTVCDLCQLPDRPAQLHTIGSGARSVDKDLCDEDAARLEEFLGEIGVVVKKAAKSKAATKAGAGRTAARKTEGSTSATRRPAPGRKTGMVVRTLDEIEQGKRG